jgi:hypothetical protein
LAEYSLPKLFDLENEHPEAQANNQRKNNPQSEKSKIK